MGLADFASKLIGDKKRWRAYRARIEALPPTYSTAASGVERYIMYNGPDGGTDLMEMFEDLADLFEQAAADDTSVRALVGDDPVEFVETFKANYGIPRWLSKEQKRLIDTITEAES